MVQEKIIYVIEHLEPRLSKWCLLEYSNISRLVGKERLVFTNVKDEAAAKKLSSLGAVLEKSATMLSWDSPCILDPKATSTLRPGDRFSHLIFGGILGDYPPKARTGEELSSKVDFPLRDLGKGQMSTDTAVRVAKMIIEGTELKQLNFIEGIEIEMNDCESVELPFTYLLEDGNPVLTPGLKSYLKKKKTF